MRCSLYIHIPFCFSKCRYCDFFSVAGHDDLIDEYLEAVAGEWKLYERNTPIELTTVYIGGGTPSFLSIAQWERFGKMLLKQLPCVSGAEWTVECNPESFSAEKASALAAVGVNRLTLGIQTLDDRELRLIGRPHTSRQAMEVLDNPALLRFNSIGIDVMYGLPGQTIGSLNRTLHALLDRPIVKHLSAYELTIAEHTPFGRHRSILPLPEEDAVSAMTGALHAAASDHGFKQYEVSNFSRDGFRCRHNSGYWDHVPYIGLGCAAHSYLHPRRFWNIGDIIRYCSMVKSGAFPVEREESIDAAALAREMAFLGFRRNDGLNEEAFREKTGMDFRRWAGEDRLQRFIDDNLVVYQRPLWRATARGMFAADYLARELF
ncbi:MAG: radical SAM family heme chaperone HemW [Chitinispirillaceae bacterium]|nr:radical SAM family heme chaperone HemW [Chitinispirillaceae bacterium]